MPPSKPRTPLSAITLDFEEGTDIYWARQQVAERMNNIWDQLPAGISGGLAPMSTPLGDMFMFTVDNEQMSLSERRYLLDWTIRPALRTVDGVADVNSLGGFVKTYEVAPRRGDMTTLKVSTSDTRTDHFHWGVVQTSNMGASQVGF